MSDSILDRVIQAREDQEKEAFDAVEAVSKLLKLLSSKEADILCRRHGLRDESAETLEKIGAAYDVTRERIRQIEHQALEKLRTSLEEGKEHGKNAEDSLASIEHVVVAILHANGGIASQGHIYSLLLGVAQDNPLYRRSLGFILNEICVHSVEKIEESDVFRPGWKLRTTSLLQIEKAITQLCIVAEHVGIPLSLEAYVDAFRHTQLYAEFSSAFNEQAIFSIIRIAQRIGENPFHEYGLIEWGTISPKRMNDRVYLILQKEGKPLHFEEIAERITKIFKKRAYPPTVHNELILNDQYVLVGRGLYALKEWGYSEGVVSEVLRDILMQHGKPMNKVELVRAVLEQRMVKKNTILLALSDKTLFHKTADGLYTVATQSVQSGEKH